MTVEATHNSQPSEARSSSARNCSMIASAARSSIAFDEEFVAAFRRRIPDDSAADLDAHRFRFGAASRADVDEDVLPFEPELLLLLWGEDMTGDGREDTLDRFLIAQDEGGVTERKEVGSALEGTAHRIALTGGDPDEALVVDRPHGEPDLVAVGDEENFWSRTANSAVEVADVVDIGGFEVGSPAIREPAVELLLVTDRTGALGEFANEVEHRHWLVLSKHLSTVGEGPVPSRGPEGHNRKRGNGYRPAADGRAQVPPRRKTRDD